MFIKGGRCDGLVVSVLELEIERSRPLDLFMCTKKANTFRRSE